MDDNNPEYYSNEEIKKIIDEHDMECLDEVSAWINTLPKNSNVHPQEITRRMAVHDIGNSRYFYERMLQLRDINKRRGV